MHKVFEFITECIGAILIAASPTIIGIGIGFLIYLKYQSKTSAVVAGLVALAFLILGVFIAFRVWKKYGTVWFLSRVSATPELDAKEDNKA